jgi:hypothetical protein
MGWDDFSRANCISIRCAAGGSTALPWDGSSNNFIGIGLGAVLRASVRRTKPFLGIVALAAILDPLAEARFGQQLIEIATKGWPGEWASPSVERKSASCRS